MSEIFKDIVVVELANVLAGPSVGMFFAELGAQVIKIENPKTGGDITRKWKLAAEDGDKKDSAYYSCINYGKESVFLDVTDPKDRVEVHNYMASADIVVSNFKPSFRTKLGYQYADIKKINPEVIYAELNAYPDMEKPAFDILLQAETGFLAMCGVDSTHLAKIPVALIDVIAGHQLKEAVLIALLRRAKTGQGAYVKTSLYESAIASLINQATNYLQVGFVPEPRGTLHSNIAPYGDIYYDNNKSALVLAIGTENQFESLLTCLGIEVKDSWLTNQLRVLHRAELNRHIQKKIGQKNQIELTDVFSSNRIPYAYIRTIAEVLDDKQRNESMLLDNKLVKSVAFQVI